MILISFADLNLHWRYMFFFLLCLCQKYRKFPKYSDTPKMCCNHSKIWTMWLYHRVMSPNDAEEMANSVGPDQTAPLGAIWSGSALFAQTYLSETLGSLRYCMRGKQCRYSCKSLSAEVRTADYSFYYTPPHKKWRGIMLYSPNFECPSICLSVCQRFVSLL